MRPPFQISKEREFAQIELHVCAPPTFHYTQNARSGQASDSFRQSRSLIGSTSLMSQWKYLSLLGVLITLIAFGTFGYHYSEDWSYLTPST